MSMVLVIVFCALMVLVVPVGHAWIIASGGGAALAGQPAAAARGAQQMFAQTQSFPMLALPFFMLAGSLMMGGKLGKEPWPSRP